MTNPAEILRKAYARIVIPEECGSYFAQIREFPGCFATGDSQIEALTNLEEAALDWLAATLELGQSIPEPESGPDYSHTCPLPPSSTTMSIPEPESGPDYSGGSPARSFPPEWIEAVRGALGTRSCRACPMPFYNCICREVIAELAPLIYEDAAKVAEIWGPCGIAAAIRARGK